MTRTGKEPLDANPLLPKKIEDAIAVINEALCLHGDNLIQDQAKKYKGSVRFTQARLIMLDVNRAQEHFRHVYSFFNEGPPELRMTKENEDKLIEETRANAIKEQESP